MTKALQQSLHRQVHSVLSTLFPQLVKSSQKQSPTSPTRFPQRFAPCGIAPGLGETGPFGVNASPRFLEGVSCSPGAPRGSASPRVGQDFPGMGTLSSRCSSDMLVFLNLSMTEGALSSYKLKGAPPWQSSLLKKYL